MTHALSRLQGQLLGMVNRALAEQQARCPACRRGPPSSPTQRETIGTDARGWIRRRRRQMRTRSRCRSSTNCWEIGSPWSETRRGPKRSSCGPSWSRAPTCHGPACSCRCGWGGGGVGGGGLSNPTPPPSTGRPAAVRRWDRPGPFLPRAHFRRNAMRPPSLSPSLSPYRLSLSFPSPPFAPPFLSPLPSPPPS